MTTMKSMIAGCALLLSSGSVMAAPLSGSFDITGLFRAENNAGVSVPFASATAIDFCAATTGACTTSPGAGTGTGAVQFNNVSPGSNFGVGNGDIGVIKDFFFSPFAAVTDFITFGDLSFDLTSITPTVAHIGGFDFLILTGGGEFHRAGFDDNDGTFSFTGQTDGVRVTGTFSFSGASAAIPVPEPATLSLLGMGLLGLGAAARSRRKSRAA